MVVCCPAVTDEGFFYLPHDKPASAPLPCLPAGWSKAVSKGTGATYFLHTGGASQFEMPSEPAEELDITELSESKLTKRIALVGSLDGACAPDAVAGMVGYYGLAGVEPKLVNFYKSSESAPAPEPVTTPAQAGPKLPEGWKMGKTNDGMDPLFINTGARHCLAKRIELYGRALFSGGVGQ